MKTILFIRHAKSSWANIGQADFDRPLNKRGENDAEAMAQKLLAKNIVIDSFISSTALRAKATCITFAKAYKQLTDIVWVEKLYHAEPPVFYEIIEALPNHINHIAIFAHNPGITDMANAQALQQEYVNMPTCGIYSVQAAIDSWANYEMAAKEKLFFTYPKELIG